MNKQILITVFKIILLMFFFNFCQSSFYYKVDSYVRKNCENKDTCTLFLKDITDFEWEQFYFIPFGKDVNDILGFKYPFDTDISNVIVFLRKGKIVYHEESILYPEKPLKYNFSKNNYLLKECLVLTPAKAVFHVTKRKIKNKKNYYLLHTVEL